MTRALSRSTLPGVAAEVGNRFVAKLVDGLVLLAVLVPLFLLLPPDVLDGGVTAGRLTTVLSGLAGFVYFVVLDARGGTLGKRLLRQRVMNAAGDRPGLGASSVRNLWLLTSLLPTAFGQLAAVLVSAVIAITIARDSRCVGIHDRLAATYVRTSA